jgi:1-aminocyclopropane-1-carboxylate deaminase
MDEKILIQDLNEDLLSKKNIQVKLARLDLLHPHYGGNKWFKLKYHIEELKKSNKASLVTFGGAYSNHIYATAAICNDLNIHAVAYVRGEQPKELNTVLQFAKSKNMELNFISRADYDLKNSSSFIQAIQLKYPDAYIIPEGGYDTLGVKGAKDILKNIDTNYNYVMCASGTFTTACGIALSLSKEQTLISIPVIKAKDAGVSHIQNLLLDSPDTIESTLDTIIFNEDYHFGGYAKKTNQLIAFINNIYIKHHIYLDEVYTAKLLFALYDLVEKNYFKANIQILIIMSGVGKWNMNK